MAKKNKISSSWLRKKIEKNLFYGSILFILLLFMVIAYAYSLPDVGIPIESQIEIYFQNLVDNFSDNSEALSPTPAPNPPNYYLFPYPSTTPIPVPTISYFPVVDELYISRSIPLIGTPPAPTLPFKTITKANLVQKFYDAILILPPYPADVHGHCVMNPKVVRFDLKFMNKGTLVQYGLLEVVACGGGLSVSLDGSYKREFWDKPLFITLVEKTFGITQNQLYGVK